MGTSTDAGSLQLLWFWDQSCIGPPATFGTYVSGVLFRGVIMILEIICKIAVTAKSYMWTRTNWHRFRFQYYEKSGAMELNGQSYDTTYHTNTMCSRRFAFWVRVSRSIIPRAGIPGRWRKRNFKLQCDTGAMGHCKSSPFHIVGFTGRTKNKLWSTKPT